MNTLLIIVFVIFGIWSLILGDFGWAAADFAIALGIILFCPPEREEDEHDNY